MPLEPSVTSAWPGSWECTLRYPSALLGKIFERPGPKSVSPARNCSGVAVVVWWRRIVATACSLIGVLASTVPVGAARRASEDPWCRRGSVTSPGGVLSHGRAPRADLRTARGAELRQDVRYVCRDRFGCEHEPFGDLPVGEACRDKLRDLELALAQRIPRFRPLGR